MVKRLEFQKWQFFMDGKSYPAQVPGDVCADLMREKLIGDALFSDNYKSIAWVHERDWTYTAEFSLKQEHLNAPKLEAVFEGIDTFAEISCNGKFAGKTENMFLKYSIDLKPFVREGKNEISVTIKSSRRIGDALNINRDGRYGSCFSENRLFLRKAQCHFGWDWAPDFPGTGIWLPAYLEAGDGKRIECVRVTPSNDGGVSFVAELTYNNRIGKPDQWIPQNPEERLELYAAMKPGASPVSGVKVTAAVRGEKNLLNIRLSDPELWYPNGYGDQPLYDYEIRLCSKDGILDRKSGTFAFRDFKVEEPVRDETSLHFDFKINGVPFRAAGSNWVPASIMTGCITREDYDKLLTDAKQAGFNMLRVWGGGVYEKEDFYDLCDRYGILVWQDFMFSCCDIPDDIPSYCDAFEIEAAYQIKRLRNHPSIAIWCGGNELTDSFRVGDHKFGRRIQRVILPGLLSDLDGTRRYLWDSPYSVTDVGDDSASGDCHRNALSIATARGEIEKYREYLLPNQNRFDSECAALGMCRPRSFAKFMPEEKRWPPNGLWEDRLACNPYDQSVPSFTERIRLGVEQLYGGADSLNDFIKKSMAVHAEVLRSEVETYRADPSNSGVMNWMFNDIWGNGTWALVDYYGERKPAYYAMKRAAARRQICFTAHPGETRLHYINDSSEPLCGVMTFSQRRIDGIILSQKNLSVDCKPYSQGYFAVEFDGEQKQSFLYAELSGLKSIYFYDLWKDKIFESDLLTGVKLSEDGKTAEVTVEAKKFARMVAITLPEGVRADCSDNYFDLVRGAKQSVTVSADRAVRAEDFRIRTFAEEWSE